MRGKGVITLLAGGGVQLFGRVVGDGVVRRHGRVGAIAEPYQLVDDTAWPENALVKRVFRACSLDKLAR